MNYVGVIVVWGEGRDRSSLEQRKKQKYAKEELEHVGCGSAREVESVVDVFRPSFRYLGLGYGVKGF